jgi:hypothetical protein
MAAYVTQFAQRYGPIDGKGDGSFWSSNPQLPYHPITTYEIGNEPNIPFMWVQDSTHLHWTDGSAPNLPPDPSDYAQVYEASRNALHAVNGSLVALVGGLADSGDYNVDLPHDEQVLAALTPGTADAVGFHPYAWQTSLNLLTMEPDTEDLRQWMNGHGMLNVPIELDEVGACSVAGSPGCNVAFSGTMWGSFVADYMHWALCTPSLDVTSYGAFYWGDEPSTDSDPMFSLVDSGGNMTQYGQAFSAEARTLTTEGCSPPLNTVPSTPPSQLEYSPKPMRLRLRGVHMRGHRLIAVVRVLPGSGRVTVRAIRPHHHRFRLHLVRRQRGGTLLTFAAKPPPGHWTVVVSCKAPPGYTAPAQLRRRLRIRG